MLSLLVCALVYGSPARLFHGHAEPQFRGSKIHFFGDSNPAAKVSSTGRRAEQWYVSFVDDKFATYGAVLAKRMHDLKHRHPLVLMVRDDSPMAHNLEAVNAVFDELGWNSRVETFKPVDVGFKTAYHAWDVAMQRVTLFGLDPKRVSRFVHLDADILVRENLDELTEKTSGPTFARRMGGCKKLSDLHVNIPVTNLFVSNPDDDVKNKIHERLSLMSTRYNGTKCMGCDEASVISNTLRVMRADLSEENRIDYANPILLNANATQRDNPFREALASSLQIGADRIGVRTSQVGSAVSKIEIGADHTDASTMALRGRNFADSSTAAGMESQAEMGANMFVNAAVSALRQDGQKINLFEPVDAIYWDCFGSHSDTELRKENPKLPEGIKLVHMGFPGRSALEHMLDTRKKKPMFLPDSKGSRFIESAVNTLVSLHLNPDVLRVAAALKR